MDPCEEGGHLVPFARARDGLDLRVVSEDGETAFNASSIKREKEKEKNIIIIE